MDEQSFVPAYAARVASLGGFLDGISYLNQDHRSDFAEAFVVDAPDDEQFPAHIQSRFAHLDGLTVRLDVSSQGGLGQLEKDIASLLLVKPFVGDEQLAENMRSYLSFKIMDRLDDVINDWSQLDDNSTFLKYAEPKRFIGTHDDIRGQMIFYLLRCGEVSFVLYFLSSSDSF